MEYNTIRLVKGTETLTSREYQKFTPGDTIWGIDSEWEELARWDIDDEERAQEELKKYTKVLYAQAKLIEGLNIDNPTEISNLICEMIAK